MGLVCYLGLGVDRTGSGCSLYESVGGSICGTAFLGVVEVVMVHGL